jgi:RNA polymerase sigma-70 factor (ECF subfamily)
MDTLPHTVGTASESPGRFEDFFESESRQLSKAMYLLTGDRQEAEDLAQDAFVRVYERWTKVQAMESPVGYLYRTALNLWRRKRKRRAGPDPWPNPAEQDPATGTETRSEVIRLLLSLSPEQREAIVLVEWLGMTAEEAGRSLRIDAASIRGRIHRAREALRKAEGRRA